MADVKSIGAIPHSTQKYYETGEVLQDTKKNGEPIDWRGDKLKNLEVADMYRALGKDLNNRVLNCGTFLEFKEKASGTKKLNRANFCDNRLCPTCNRRKSWQRSKEMTKVLDKAQEKNPTGRFIFLTLTIENAHTAEQLARELREINQAFGRLTRYKKLAKNLLGYIRATEVPVNQKNKNAGKYHHHIHAILFVKPTYFRDKNNYITQAEYTDLWQKALKSDTPYIVNVKIVRPDDNGSYIKSAIETGKYTLKDDDYLPRDKDGNLLNRHESMELIDELSDALRNTRDFSYGGILRQIKREIKSEDTSETESESESDNIDYQTIQAHWYWYKQNYYVWREKTQDKDAIQQNAG